MCVYNVMNAANEVVACMCRVLAWRRRLMCTICQRSDCGACIRCEMPACTNAFHATCAQSAGIYMRLEPALSGANGSRCVPARRTVYCDLHRPVETASVRAGAEFTYKLNGCLKLSKKPETYSSNIRAFTTSLYIPAKK